MATKIPLTGGGFQSFDGTVVANGTIIMEINQDCLANGEFMICSGSTVVINLDSAGSVVDGQAVWSNVDITPHGTFYIVTVKSSTGQSVWGPNLQQVPANDSPFNVAHWILNDINPNP